jgi:hypothetical protein
MTRLTRSCVREEQEQQWADYIYDAARAYRAGLEEARAAALGEESEEEAGGVASDRKTSDQQWPLLRSAKRVRLPRDVFIEIVKADGNN